MTSLIMFENLMILLLVIIITYKIGEKIFYWKMVMAHGRNSPYMMHHQPMPVHHMPMSVPEQKVDKKKSTSIWAFIILMLFLFVMVRVFTGFSATQSKQSNSKTMSVSTLSTIQQTVSELGTSIATASSDKVDILDVAISAEPELILYLQVASYSDYDAAYQRYHIEYQNHPNSTYLGEAIVDNQLIYKVLLGPFSASHQANSFKAKYGLHDDAFIISGATVDLL